MMNIDAKVMELPLTKGSFVRIDDISEVEVTCLEGSVWLTTDDDPRDTVLAEGKSFISNLHRRALVSALGASRIRLNKASPNASGTQSLSADIVMPFTKKTNPLASIDFWKRVA